MQWLSYLMEWTPPRQGAMMLSAQTGRLLHIPTDCSALLPDMLFATLGEARPPPSHGASLFPPPSFYAAALMCTCIRDDDAESRVPPSPRMGPSSARGLGPTTRKWTHDMTTRHYKSRQHVCHGVHSASPPPSLPQETEGAATPRQVAEAIYLRSSR